MYCWSFKVTFNFTNLMSAQATFLVPHFLLSNKLFCWKLLVKLLQAPWVQAPSLEPSSRTAGQEIFRSSWNPKINYSFHKKLIVISHLYPESDESNPRHLLAGYKKSVNCKRLFFILFTILRIAPLLILFNIFLYIIFNCEFLV